MDLSSSDFRNLPALAPPAGVIPEFDHPTDTLGMPLKIVNGVFVSLAFITVAVRIISRQYISRQRLAWDDGLCIVAMIGSIVHTTLILDNISIGYGRHFWDIRAISLSAEKIRRLNSVDIVYGIVIYIIKVSILLLYYRLFSIYASSRKLIYGGIVLCTIITLPYLAMAIARSVICSGFKVVLEHLTFCYTRPVNTSIVTFSAVNVVSDFYILGIALARVRKLHIDKKSKLGLSAVFVVGLGACVMSIVRLIFVGVNMDNSDVFYRGASTSCFTAVEMNLAIMCSCSVSFPAFYRRGRAVVAPVTSQLSWISPQRKSPARSEKPEVNDLHTHGLVPLDSNDGQKADSERSGRTADKAPHLSTLNMTRATIDIES